MVVYTENMKVDMLLDRRLVLTGLAVGVGFTLDALVWGLEAGNSWWVEKGTIMFDIWGVVLGLAFAFVSWKFDVFGKTKKKVLWLMIWESYGEYLLIALLAWIMSLLVVILSLVPEVGYKPSDVSLGMTVHNQVSGMGLMLYLGWLQWIRFFWWGLLGPLGAYWGTVVNRRKDVKRK